MTQPLPPHVTEFLDAAKIQAQYVLDQAQLALDGATAEAARDFHAEADELQADADAKVEHAQAAVVSAQADLAYWSGGGDQAVSDAYNAASPGARSDAVIAPHPAAAGGETSGR